MRLNFLLLFLVLNLMKVQAQDIYTPEKSKEFAAYLFKSGQYELSAAEYERLLYLEKTNDSLKYALVNSYFNNGELDRAVKRAESLYPSLNEVSGSMADLYLEMLILGRNFDKFDKNYSKLPVEKERLSTYQLHRQILAGNWDEVERKIPQISPSIHPSISNLRVLSSKAQSFQPKRPWVAGLLSAVLPGGGKFYTGNVKDGIFSLIVVGGSAFQAYRGFSKDGVSSTSGWIFGTLSTGFYAGNIYGSAKSAQVYNEKFWFELEKDAEDIIRSSY